MNTEAALLQAIRQQPEDDLPRVAYADFLEEHGQGERAELIRLQVRRAALPDNAPQVAMLRRRENLLLKQHPDWASTGLGVVGTLVRGFIEEVSLSPEQFVELGAALCERFPLRRLCLRVEDELAPVRKLAACPALRSLRELRLQAAAFAEIGLGDLGLRALMGSPFLEGLRALELPGCRLSNSLASDIAGAASLGPLVALDLKGNRLEADGIETLALAPRLAGLKRLGLENTRLGPAGAEALAASSWRLEALDLTRSRILTAGVRALTRTRFLAGIQQLKLGWLNIGPQPTAALAKCAHVKDLEVLVLNRNRLGDSGVASLAGSPYLAGLRHLGLKRNRITLAGMTALGESPHLRGVKVLELGSNMITGEEKVQLRSRFGKGWGKF